jgi:hypothetical protein
LRARAAVLAFAIRQANSAAKPFNIRICKKQADAKTLAPRLGREESLSGALDGFPGQTFTVVQNLQMQRAMIPLYLYLYML